MAERGPSTVPLPAKVETNALAVALASEVESRDDDEDWEMETWGKFYIVEQLRSLPLMAEYSHDAHTAVLRFQDVEAGEAIEMVDITVGVVANVASRGGKIVALEFSLTEAVASRWLRMAVGEAPPPSALVAERLSSENGQMPSKRITT